MGTEKTKAMQMPPRRECVLFAQWFEYENDDEYEKYDASSQNPVHTWLMLGACMSNPALVNASPKDCGKLLLFVILSV